MEITEHDIKLIVEALELYQLKNRGSDHARALILSLKEMSE